MRIEPELWRGSGARVKRRGGQTRASSHPEQGRASIALLRIAEEPSLPDRTAFPNDRAAGQSRQNRAPFCSRIENGSPLPANQNALEDPPSRLSARTIGSVPATFGRARISPSCASETPSSHRGSRALCHRRSRRFAARDGCRSSPATGMARSTRSGPHCTALLDLGLFSKRVALRSPPSTAFREKHAAEQAR